MSIQQTLSRQKDNVIVVNIGDTNLVHDLDPHLNLIYIRPLDPLGRAFAFQPETAPRKIDMGWYDTMKAFGRFSGQWMYFPNAEYQRLRDELGDNVAEGLEYAARLYGLDRLRECTAEIFIRELLNCERVSAEKYRTFRGKIDVPALLRAVNRGREEDIHLTSDILLQMTMSLAENKEERPRILAMVRRMAPDFLRAAEALLHLRAYVEGN